jgi:hypothetical protein
MAGISTYLLILALNINGFNYPSNDNVWQTGLKRKTRQSVVYKTPTLLTETNTGLG